MSEDLNSLARKIRIFSGAVLFFYVLTHLLNHSVNIISIPAADYIYVVVVDVPIREPNTVAIASDRKI